MKPRRGSGKQIVVGKEGQGNWGVKGLEWLLASAARETNFF